MNLTFIKLDINILNDTKIKLIRKMPDGDSLLVLWIGILCLAMKSGRPGIVEIGDGIPFSDESLAVELDIELNTIRLGMDVFKKFKMIEVWEGGEIYLLNFEKHQEIDQIDKAKKISKESSRRYREKMRGLLPETTAVPSSYGHRDVTVTSRDAGGDNHGDVTVTPGDGTDKEEDKDKDKEIKHVSIETCSSTDVSVDAVALVETPVSKCPHAEIIALWNRLMPELPHVRAWGDKSRANLQARWKSGREIQDLSWWEGFFIYIRGSDFLMGRKKEFKASLDWVVKPSNFEKIVNGNYANSDRVSTGSRITDQNMRAVKEFLDG